jgi:2-polyprenyl-3-methyl-5-hydroxy-6-metoxy-1,4-benzoquinol methylase
MIQTRESIEAWHSSKDPWNYNTNSYDLLRRDMLLSELPEIQFKNVLDIGCGQGFITKQIVADNVTGIDISHKAIEYAQENYEGQVKFLQGSIFDVHTTFENKFDLIIITGVLYQQYIGDASNLIYVLIDQILEDEGHLVSVHINEWNICRFPYLRTKEIIYPYRDYNHKLEVYSK